MTVSTIAAVSVSNPTVNEASPYAVFTLTGTANQTVSLSTIDGSADINNNSSNIEYWTGTTWKAYNGTSTNLLSDGTLLVRVGITQESDTINELDETFQLQVTPTGGATYSGAATIVDDGNGIIYPNANPTNPTTPASNTTGLDDDRVIGISSPTVNEASPYAVFTLTGAANQAVSLSTIDGSADINNSSSNIEYWTGTAWITYNGTSTNLLFNGTLLVRVDITQESDTINELDEIFQLLVTPTGGATYSGTATIVDAGNGVIYPNANPTNPTTPATTTTGLDDDRVIGISNPTVKDPSTLVLEPNLKLDVKTDSQLIGDLITANGMPILTLLAHPARPMPSTSAAATE